MSSVSSACLLVVTLKATRAKRRAQTAAALLNVRKRAARNLAFSQKAAPRANVACGALRLRDALNMRARDERRVGRIFAMAKEAMRIFRAAEKLNDLKRRDRCWRLKTANLALPQKRRQHFARRPADERRRRRSVGRRSTWR